MTAMKPNGISVLIASQNAVRTVGLSVRSFLPFADEIIAVDNGSTDGTVAILGRLADDYPKVTFVNAAGVVHLHENRQIAYERSRFRWVFRGDSDFIAWTSGPRDIRNLRDHVLRYPVVLTRMCGRPGPIVFDLMGNYVVGDWHHALPDRQVAKLGPRVYQDVPGMAFCRVGRHETVQLPGRTDERGWEKIHLPTIHILHADIREPMSQFLRAYRQAWREHGDFAKCPTLASYVQYRLGVPDLGAAAAKWVRTRTAGLVPYTGEYPELVEQMLQADTSND